MTNLLTWAMFVLALVVPIESAPVVAFEPDEYGCITIYDEARRLMIDICGFEPRAYDPGNGGTVGPIIDVDEGSCTIDNATPLPAPPPPKPKKKPARPKR